MCELLCGDNLIKHLGLFGPLLPLALITLDTLYLKSIVLCECYIQNTVDVADNTYFYKYTFPSLHLIKHLGLFGTLIATSSDNYGYCV